MNYFKNVSEEVQKLSDMISNKPHQIASMGLSRAENCDIRLFAFAEGEEVKQETYPMDTLYICLEGKMILKKDNMAYHLTKGDCMAISLGTPHSVHSDGNFKMMQIMLKGE